MADGWCYGFSKRLTLLGRLLDRAGQPANHELSLRVIPEYIRIVESRTSPGESMIGVVCAAFDPASTRGDPSAPGTWLPPTSNLVSPTLSGWEALAELVQAAPPTPEYLEDLRARFQDFADEMIEEATNLLDKSPEEAAERLPDELEELSSLESVWGASVDVRDLLDRLEDPDIPTSKPVPR